MCVDSVDSAQNVSYLGDIGGGFPGAVSLPHDSIGQRLIHLYRGESSVGWS